ncbi:MAG: c-type cytochrome [Acidobacteriota bacterium]|nr:c-type cytochrome [Acidobacteriota bacterium]
MKRHVLFFILSMCAFQAFAGQGDSLIEQAPAKAQATSNPLAGSANASRAGARLFDRECRACHGRSAEGTGKAPSLTSIDISAAPAGALFWVLRNGSLHRGMPSFAHLPESQRWQIVTYLQTLHSSKGAGQ